MDQREIDQRAREINSDNSVRQKAVRAHAALISYFDGEDPTGVIKSPNREFYAAFITILTGGSTSEFDRRRQKGSETLREELAEELMEAGFVTSGGELSVPGRSNYTELPSTSVGPLLPAVVAILQVEHGIDSTDAVRQYRPGSVETILPEEKTVPESTEDETLGTDQDWEANIRNAPGFDPTAAAYVYVLELTRMSDSSTWYYVGKREGGFSDLVSYIRGHARDFTRSRVVKQNGRDIVVGNYNASMKLPGVTHRVSAVERLVPLSSSDLDSFDDSGARSCFIAEIERRTAYEVALEKGTTNVLGGK
ncbi:hypothetical protein ACFPYI_21835 [Halomarina salina]|uniref:GIY-YIG nuclease family protein n=1 Tax=Halomarina salina TaxID=1872699 RepID=A0ABD5RTQ1_9EURY|nr:hypothetical protein [Halomarina salina]